MAASERVVADHGQETTPAAAQAGAGPQDVTALLASLQRSVGNAGVNRLIQDGVLRTEQVVARWPWSRRGINPDADPDGMHDGRGGVAVAPPAPAPDPAAGPPTAVEAFRTALAAGDFEAAVLALDGAGAAIPAEVATLTPQQCRRLVAALRESRRITATNNVEAPLKAQGGILPGRIFGEPNTERTLNHAAAAGGNYSFDQWIQFTPDPLVVDCNEIVVVQTVRVVNAVGGANAETLPHLIRRQNTNSTSIDRIEGRRYGYYGYNNDGRASGDPGTRTIAGAGGNMRAGSSDPVRAMRYYDGPGDSMVNVKFEFETAIVARTGPQRGLVYSVVKWGFDVNAAGRLTAHRVRFRDRVSSDFQSARRAWNRQATGPVAQRNDPNQNELLGLR